MPEQPILGLMEESLLPKETRTLPRSVFVPVAGPSTLVVGQSLCVISVSSTVEVPSLVSGRFGSLAEVTSLDAESVTLRAQSRVRIKSAKGREPPFIAQVEGLDAAPSLPAELIASARSMISALAEGGVPEVVGWEANFEKALLDLVRTLLTPDELKLSMIKPIGEVLEQVSRNWRAAKPAGEASQRLLEIGPELAGELSLRRRHELWSEIVAIQKRLDVYDPSLKIDESDNLGRLTKKLMQTGLPADVMSTANRELKLLSTMSPTHHDYATYLSHLDFIARLPWHPEPVQKADLKRVAEVLDRGHFGLEKVKRRALEFLAARELGGTSASMILCLVGPPGVGKTTIARAMAEALGRKFVRIALGGVHDESEIRGHRLSFVAAAPGRILNGIAHAGSMTSLVLLDEIDKIGTDRGRSPGAALHEVLDPEQHTHFRDNYLGLPYDLSHVLFVATANDESLIAPTLRDRLEPLEIEGYSGLEKKHIARAHLLHRLQIEHGLGAEPEISDEILDRVIDGYTKEAGVRQLKRVLSSLYRGRALDEYNGTARPREIDASEVEERLGAPLAKIGRPKVLPVGVALGLSVGQDGGSILAVEVAISAGKGEVKMTGRLGDVLRESVEVARTYIKVHREDLRVDEAVFSSDVHVHLPEASVPKEGPSAGVAIFLALLSAFTRVPVRADVAMTGEINLSGRVSAVGGIRAKVLAAERESLEEVFVPSACRADVPRDLKTKVTLIETLADLAARGLEGDSKRP
ncbi:MAG: AAA family ATPase [Deltaproteobacteria bacterium]|nr:AAA family ATPase [Deltaproteobacteria bacterium]